MGHIGKDKEDQKRPIRKTKTFGKKLNEKGEWVPNRIEFTGKSKKEVAEYLN